MCGPFTQRYTWREIYDLYDLTGAARNLQAHYNIAPTDTVEVVRPLDCGVTEGVPMRWGLIPYWWKKPLKQLPATFNARAESVASKPMFRDAFKRHSCIIPASGCYDANDSRPHAGAARQGSYRVLAEWRRWDRTTSTGRRGSRSHVAGVQARQQDR
jgi:putative SOS response-associated peptidase YedK